MPELTETEAWALLRALADRARRGRPEARPVLQASWPAARLLELLLPVCTGPRAASLVVAHLGQSLDGRIATAGGESRWVTGEEDCRHVHRLRALMDAVLVGRETVECDDPRLTVRLVPGESPARIVVDPDRRLTPERRVLTDGEARTILVCREGARGPSLPGVEVIAIPERHGRLDPRDIVGALRERDLRRILVEGGGVTVSRFLEACAVDRLHLAVAPVLLGLGRPGLALPAVERLGAAARLRATRHDLGQDVLFDCDLAA